MSSFDYTFRVAESLLKGSVSVDKTDLSWLNELVPFEGFWYSVFPLGSVITMIPAAILKSFGLINEMPVRTISALTASLICLFLILIARNYKLRGSKKLLLIYAVLFGTWMWVNLTIAGAWQLALGFAVLGELGAIYYTIFKPRPLAAGAFFALAFGNRTEILLTAPIFIFFLLRQKLKNQQSLPEARENEVTVGNKFSKSFASIFTTIIKYKREVAAFCFVPFVIGILTLFYNYVRFHSIFDFGYARIP